jgi:hypothetical protein
MCAILAEPRSHIMGARVRRVLVLMLVLVVVLVVVLVLMVTSMVPGC